VKDAKRLRRKQPARSNRAAVLMALTAWDVVSIADKHGVDAVAASSTLHAENGIG